MVEKRKRYVTVRESTHAKRRSASPTHATTTPEVPARSLAPDVPASFAKDGPLPVVPNRQVEGLLLKDYRSVAESKVMAESLIRSQRKWVDGDVFEKFWTKPLKSRKLDPTELEKNPSRDCMTKLGNCTLSCKPHKFEIRLFGVLEPVKAPLVQQQPAQRPQSQLPAPATPMATAPYMNTPQHPSYPNTGAHAAPAHQPATFYVPPQQPAPSQAPAMPPSQVSGPLRQPPPPDFIIPAPPPNVLPPAFIVPPQPLNPHAQQPYHQQSGNQSVAQQAPTQTMVQQAPPRPDPVIQSLAVRAASDPELKALMRIVASGKATTEQLKTFQGHIDALTPVTSPPIVGRPRSLAPAAQGSVGAQAPTRQVAPQQMHPQHQQHRQQPQHLHQHQQPQYLQHQQHHQHLQHQQHPHHFQYAQHPQYSQQQPQLPPHRPVQYSQPQPQVVHAPQKPRPFPQPPKQEITSVVFEFIDPHSQGDRFIFPKYTILEYVKNGTMVKASFMVTRKPVDDLDEYYQPITIILESMSPRTLEILQKVVADQETTCKYMKHLMETRKRAEDSFLVFRLRRDPNEAVPNKPEVQERIEPPPQKAIRESRVRRDTSTPTRDSKGSADHTPQPVPPSRPRVKTVKKALPKEQPQVVTPVTISDPSFIVPITPIPRTPRQPKPPRSRKGRIADPTKSCSLCNTSKTSLWRKADINGENVTVCNACGIKWKTSTQRAAQVATAQATGQPLPGMGSRENSCSGDVRPTAQQLSSGGPRMQFHPFPQGSGEYAAPQNGGEQPAYLATIGGAHVGQVYQQPFPGYQGQGASLPAQQHQQQQMQVMPSQQNNSTHQIQQYPQNAEAAPQPSAVDEQKESEFSAASLIVASHVAAHQPQPPTAPAPASRGLSAGTASAGS